MKEKVALEKTGVLTENCHEKTAMNICRNNSSRLISVLLTCLILSTAMFSANIMHKYDFSFTGSAVKCGEPFYLTVDLISKDVDLRNVYVEIPSEFVMKGDYDEMADYYGEMVDGGKTPRPLLRILSTELLVNEEGKKVFRMLLNGTAEGIMNFGVVLSDDKVKYSEERIPIRFEIPKEKVTALENRMDTVEESMKNGTAFASKNFLGTDYFGCSMPSEVAVVVGGQYTIHHMVARKSNPAVKLKYDISYYYPPLYSKTEPLSYLPTYVLKLKDSYYVIREDILIIKTTPIYDSKVDETSVKIFHPQVNWKTVDDKPYTNESFSNEYEQIEYLSPKLSIPIINGMKASVSVENESVTVDEYNLMSLIIESESIMLEQPIKFGLIPEDVEIVEVGSDVVKVEELNGIKYVYNYDYILKCSSPSNVEISIDKFEFFDLKSGATATVLPYSFEYEVIPSGESGDDSEIYLGLNDLRRNTGDDIDLKRFEYGILAYSQGNIDDAAKIFESLAAEYFYSADIHYNLGVVYSDSGKVYEAQVEFYRSALLNPMEDVIQNINLLQKHYFLSGQKIFRYFNMNMTLVITFILAAAFSFSISLITLFRKKRKLFMLTLIISIVLGCFCLFTVIGAYSNPAYAVVSYPCYAYAGPGFDYPQFKKLSTGNVVQILEEEDTFCKILLNDGIYYWIDKDNLEFVFPNG